VNVRLRAAEPEDREQLARLLAEYLFEFDGRTEPYPFFDAYWTEPDRLPFLVELDGDAIGLILIRVMSDGWSIAEFAVVPARRRLGVGRAAVEALAERAREAEAPYLEAKVNPNNLEALPFWLAVGFHEVPSPDVTVTRRYL